jgi:transposase-like protein
VRTISRHFGVDPRTIRNWLHRADEALGQWRGEQHDD